MTSEVEAEIAANLVLWMRMQRIVVLRFMVLAVGLYSLHWIEHRLRHVVN